MALPFLISGLLCAKPFDLMPVAGVLTLLLADKFQVVPNTSASTIIAGHICIYAPLPLVVWLVFTRFQFASFQGDH